MESGAHIGETNAYRSLLADTFLLCNQETVDSYLGPETGYPVS